jgi:hypothetical protein
MPWDIAVELEDRPGTLAQLGAAAGDAGINISGVCGTSGNGGVIHILVDDAESASPVLASAGLVIQDTREVLVVEVEDRPGVLGETAKRFGDAGINIDLVYLAAGTRLVLGVDDIEAARSLA